MTASHAVDRPLHILLVEDNPGDIQLVMRALRESPLLSQVTVMRDGEAALTYLGTPDPTARRKVVDLILLDLNLPRIDGWQVLQHIKSDPSLRTIPVVILTSSTRGDDIQRCYQLHANAYVAKPATFRDLRRVLHDLERFWGQVALRAAVTGE